MAVIPQHWRDFTRLQHTLGRTNRVDDRYWGLEAGLDRVVSLVAEGATPTSDEIERARQSESRRERYRRRLRDQHFARNESSVDPSAVFEARSELRALRSSVSSRDWKVLTAVGLGKRYSEIAKVSGTRSVAIRARVMRLRKKLKAQGALSIDSDSGENLWRFNFKR
jgi:DNA-binding NarL/FixJ family response regulator